MNDTSNSADTLLELAAAIEAGDPPDLLDLRHALGSFRAAGLDKRAQQHVIEAREDAKAGRIPDPLLLRMVAKAVAAASTDPSPHKIKAKTRLPAAPAMVSVAERTVRPDGVGFTTVKLVPVADAPPAVVEAPLEPEPEPFRGVDVDHAVGSPGESFIAVGAAARELAEAEEDEDEDEDNEAAPGGGYDREFFAQEEEKPVDVFGWIANKRDKLEREVEAYEEKRNGNGHSNGNGHASVEEDDVEEDEAPPWEVVAQAADLIEHMDMPANAELVGALYNLASKLETMPIGVTIADDRPLLERTEAEIARRIERAIASSADLPLWVIEWARMERDRKPEESIFFSDTDAPKGEA